MRTPIDLSKAIRNAIYLRRSCAATVLAIAALWINLVSSWGLEWLGVAVQLVLVAWAASMFLLWRRATLRVDHESVRVGGLLRPCVLQWAEVTSFSILDPVDRTLFVWVFTPWKTQGRLHLRDGSSLRTRAVQPWPSNWTYDRPEDADRLIDALNDSRATRPSARVDSAPWLPS